MNVPSQIPPVVGAVAFDGMTPRVVAAVVSLCRQLGAAGELVHVVDLLANPLYTLSGGIADAFYWSTAAEDVLGAELDGRAKQMHDLIASLPPGPALTGKVVSGATVDTLIGRAASSRAQLLVSAVKPRMNALMPAGLSVAVGLAQRATVPVLLVSERPLDPAGGALRILVADDLTAECAPAVEKAFALAGAAKPGSRLRHLHVAPRAMERQQVLKMMESRGGDQRCCAEANVRPEVELHTGDFAAVLRDVIADFDPDLVVFGRHKTLHARPFYIGRAPFKTMVSAQRAVLIVPPARAAG